jgi:hypothetical protein
MHDFAELISTKSPQSVLHGRELGVLGLAK